MSVPCSWHTLSAAAAAAELNVDPARGLSQRAAAARLAEHGPNLLPAARRRGPARLLAAQFSDVMILVLIAAAVVAALVGEPVDAAAIAVIIILNAVIGFVQDYRAGRALAALQDLAAPRARVRRGGRVLEVDARALVPGDVVLLEAGDIVPADLRLVEAAGLTVNEAALTGESIPVVKAPGARAAAAAPLGERRNMAFKGTTVTRGRAAGLVVATGPHTELGRIAALLETAEQGRTPLQRRLARFGRRLALAVLAVCALIFIAGLLRGEAPLLMFLTAVSLAVAAIPEALPAVVTITLALGARRMVGENALVRRLPAVETLGSVTVICTDKTGTLTENAMRLEKVCSAAGEHDGLPSGDTLPGRALGTALALSNDVQRGAAGWVGDPTEIALVEAAAAAGYDKAALSAVRPRIAERPFDAARQCMTTVHGGESPVAYTKGAPEAVLGRCRAVLTAAGPAPLETAAWLARAEALAARGFRVLAVACRELGSADEPPEQDLLLLALVALMDPPRAEAAAAVAECRRAGITPVMITGDHPGTARAVARRVGIAGEKATVLLGEELATLSGPALRERVLDIAVYARVAPAQKLRIVEALQERGQVVAMTGDGVNDAPALKQADIGVAMGRGGTEVAREAADLVLLDDNFATIVAAVKEGRRLYDNIRKFIKYTMTSNAGEIWVLFLAPFLGLPLPLLPIHILWINLLTDGLPGLALAAEPAEGDVMARPPRPLKESVFAHGMWQHILWCGLLIGGVSLAAQAWALAGHDAHWQTMVFTTLVFAQLAQVFAVRGERQSLFAQGVFSNGWLLGAAGLTAALQLAVIYLPGVQGVFKTGALTVGELAFCLALPLLVLVAVEVEKALLRRGWLYR